MITSGVLNNSVTRQLSRVPFWSCIGMIPYSSRSTCVSMCILYTVQLILVCVRYAWYSGVRLCVCVHLCIRTRGRNFHCELIFFLSFPPPCQYRIISLISLSIFLFLSLSVSNFVHIIKMTA